MKRFYKTVETRVDAQGCAVLLDGRPIRTPARTLLALPTAGLADAVAQEWRDQGETINPHAMPLTGMANAVIDRIQHRHTDVADEIARYGETDLVCYRAEGPAELVARQAAVWDPLLAWIHQRYDVHLACATGLMPQPQPERALAALRRAVHTLTPWQLSPAHAFVTITGSLVITLALLDRWIGAQAAWEAGELDALWQAVQWGEDELAARARAARRTELDAAVRFLRLLG